MGERIGKCNIEWCDENIHANGFCSSHNHYYHKSGKYGGVYRITIADKFYIGKASISAEKRMNEEKSALKNNHKTTVSKELLEYFNKICINEFGQDKYLDKELRNRIINEKMKFELIKPMFPFIKCDGSDWVDEEEKKQRTFMWHIKYKDNKLGELERHWYEKYERAIDNAETIEINKYRKLDRENGTNNLLNKNKVRK